MDAPTISVGVEVQVADGRQGIVAMEEDDGKWTVMFDDGTEGDFYPDALQLCRPANKPAVDLESGVRIVDNPDVDSKPDGWTRFVCFSDTHGVHNQIPKGNRPHADVLLHAGDLTNTGELEQVESFNEWLVNYPAKFKVVIAGNHDITFHEEYYQDRGAARFHIKVLEDGTQKAVPYDTSTPVRELLKDCIYLEDSSVEVCGYTIFGSPWQPEFCDWAFNLPPGQALREKWMQIPESVDVLLTHSPAHGFVDKTSSAKRAGCPELRAAIEQRSVSVSVSGHIHDAYGYCADDATLYINASTCNKHYRPTNAPIVFDLPPPEELRVGTRQAAVRRRETMMQVKP